MKKNLPLKSILYNTYFKTALVPLIVIEITLLILYFGISKYIVSNTKNLSSQEIKTNLLNISQKETQEINYQLKEISNIALIAQYEQEKIFKEKDEILKNIKAPEFKYAKNGTFYKVNNDGGASLLYAATTNIGKKEKEKAIFTEAFDDKLKYYVDNNKLIVASYFNSFDNMNRLYPFIEEVYSQYPADIKMQNYNFYYEADQEHNPQRTTKWTTAYLDPAGQGWMVSCIVPIYTDDFLEGVTGFDVTIDKFIKYVLNLDLPWNANAMLVDQNGLILAMPKEIQEKLNIEELTSHNYDDVITDTNLKPDEFNIYKNKELYKYFKELKDNKQMISTTINNNEYLITQSNIEQTNWKLFIFVDKETIFKQLNELDDIAKKIGFAAILGMILFYLLFFAF
ncbi:MAG: cache domain-containing protein [Halarcobacter ebronensis]